MNFHYENEYEDCDHEDFVVGRDYRCNEFQLVYICKKCGSLVDYEEAKQIILYRNVDAYLKD